MVMVMKRTRSRLVAAVRLAPAAATALALTAASPVRASGAGSQATPIVTQDLRLASVGYRIARQNADRCQSPERLTGLLLHDRAAYDARDRALIGARFGLGEGFGVRDVVEGSAADRAGLRRGDEIVALNGTAMAGFAQDLVGRKASYQRSDAFETLLGTALRQGAATLLFRRDGTLRTLRLTADAGCGGHWVVVPGKAFNAWSDGHYVAVTSRLMTEITDDAELAFVVAHEMSHNILRHQEALRGRSALLSQLGFGSARVKDTEIEADTLAIGLLARAGYDLSAPARFLVRAAQKRPFDVPITHPGLKRRIGIVTAEIARLQVSSSRAAVIAPSNAAVDGIGADTPSPDLATASTAKTAD